MNIVAIVGTNAGFSYNRKLLWAMKKMFQTSAQIEIVELLNLPLFCEDEEIPVEISALTEKITAADALIISTPEYDHAITAALKSLLEWLSFDPSHPLLQKPCMIVGASLGNLGTVFAQENLRQILNAPGLEAHVLSGHQFLLGRADQCFTTSGALKDEHTIAWLTQCFEAFLAFVHLHDAVSTDNTSPLQLDDKTKWWIENTATNAGIQDDAQTGSTEDLDDGTSLFA